MTAKLRLRSLHCTEPATSFGDDVEIFVNGISAGGQFPIDQGQYRDISAQPFDFAGQAILGFQEDGDPGGFDVIVPEDLVDTGVQMFLVRIKSDGRYELYCEVFR
jgi:hypothetical protein